ncbi:hypothetical protein C6P46_003435 [Rhodotorula mucilaginosa]|uniref:Uncharacterized protein n=1 Tax=Rhodotorula mucilaginosa TaxID=5537 RepID=A0A9P7B6D0_RHOMI|nr:hypothetical protein C6P46_003435 [Rhodotorula mucilaginosa]
MKAGAFGRQPERRQAQPGGRVLPGMFVAPPASAAASAPANKKTASTSPPPPASTTSSPKGSRKQEGVLSRWESGGQGSGRLPPTTTSRLDRALGTASISPERPTRSTPPVDSIARARRLGLNRAPRTPPPPASESSASDDSDEQETPLPRPNQQSNRHVRTRSQSSPSPTRVPPPARQRVSGEEEDGDRRRGAGRTSSPPRRESSTLEAAEETAPPKPAPRPLPGLLSSLWNRASELVAGNAPATAAPTASDEAASSSNKPGAEGEEEVADKGERSLEADTTRRGKRPARPIVVPALVAPALAGILPNAKIAPDSAKSSTPSLPPPEPITYHRPPALHPRLNHEESPRFRSQPTPYDWLDARDESRLLPYMFLPTATQAAAYEARMRAQANKAAAPHAAAAAAAVSHVAAPTSTAPPQAHAPLAASLHASPMAMVAASMPARGLQLERPTEARRAASDHGQQAPAQPPRERIRSKSVSGASMAPLAAGGLALGALAGSGTATLPPLVQSAFASPPTSEPTFNPGIGVPPVMASTAPVVSASAAPVPAPAPALGSNQGVPLFAAAPAAAYGGAAFAAPPDEFLPRYTETEQAPRPASPATHPTTTSGATESQAPLPSAVTAGAGGTAGRTVASSAQSAPEVPRAGVGGDSLPIHPSPAQYSAAAPSPAPVVPSYTSAPMGLAPGVIPWAAAPIQTAPSGYQSGNGPTSGVATSAPAETITAPSVSAPSSSQAPPPSLPPLVPPASFPALQSTAAPCVPLPMVTSYPASLGNPAVPQDPQLPSLGPAALLRGAKTALKRAVLAMDPGADDFPSLSRRAQLGSGANSGGRRSELADKDDLPPMPKPRPVPVSPPPPTDPISSSRSSSDLSTTPLPNTTLRPHIHSTYVSAATPLPGTVVAATSMPIIPTRSTFSSAMHQPPSSSPALSESANTLGAFGSDAALPVAVAAEKGDANAAASLASSSPSTASGGTSCSSPATTLPNVVTPPPPPVPVKSPSLTSLSPPSVPRRPASIPPLPEASSSSLVGTAATPTSPPPPPQEEAFGQPETRVEKVVGISEPASPAEKPRFELQTLDLDLPDFGVGFSLATPSEADAGCTISQIQSVMEDRVTSYSIAARPTVSGSTSDPLDDAFEETTTFVAGFAQASLLRATIDPNHTGRTEKWLEQMGVRPRLMSEIDRSQESQAPRPENAFPDSFFRPLTAPPASIAPEMTQRLQTSSPSMPASLSSREAAKSPPPAGLRQLSTNGLVAQSSVIGSPLETSIGAIDAEGGLMKRARAVSPDVEARARASRSAKLETLQTKSISPASGTVVTASTLSATSGERSENATLTSVEVADFEPLVGDQGETASEVAAMFAHW